VKREGCLILKEKCGARGSFSSTHEPGNKHTYSYAYADRCIFEVANEFNREYTFNVIAYNPYYLINDLSLFSPGETKEFEIQASKNIEAFVRIQNMSFDDLKAACKPDRNCLKIEYFSRRLNEHTSSATEMGIGAYIGSTGDGITKFKVTNKYPVSMEILTTAHSEPEACVY
jgi:hypothetical protein